MNIRSLHCTFVVCSICWFSACTQAPDLQEPPSSPSGEACAEQTTRESCDALGCTNWIEGARSWELAGEDDCVERAEPFSACWTNAYGHEETSHVETYYCKTTQEVTLIVHSPTLIGELDGWEECDLSDYSCPSPR